MFLCVSLYMGVVVVEGRRGRLIPRIGSYRWLCPARHRCWDLDLVMNSTLFMVDPDLHPWFSFMGYAFAQSFVFKHLSSFLLDLYLTNNKSLTL